MGATRACAQKAHEEAAATAAAQLAPAVPAHRAPVSAGLCLESKGGRVLAVEIWGDASLVPSPVGACVGTFTARALAHDPVCE